VALVLDYRGMRCPRPVIELAKAWAAVPLGEVVHVLADDPAAGPDLQAWCRMRGQAYDGSPEPGTYALRRLA
jgi:tRNA 2-thiouridine synthesizing protein A